MLNIRLIFLNYFFLQQLFFKTYSLIINKIFLSEFRNTTISVLCVSVQQRALKQCNCLSVNYTINILTFLFILLNEAQTTFCCWCYFDKTSNCLHYTVRVQFCPFLTKLKCRGKRAFWKSNSFYGFSKTMPLGTIRPWLNFPGELEILNKGLISNWRNMWPYIAP